MARPKMDIDTEISLFQIRNVHEIMALDEAWAECGSGAQKCRKFVFIWAKNQMGQLFRASF